MCRLIDRDSYKLQKKHQVTVFLMWAAVLLVKKQMIEGNKWAEREIL
jgi:hypothetical protein